MIVSKFSMPSVLTAIFLAFPPFLHAAHQEEPDIPSMTRTWTNKETGATFQARLVGLNSVNAIMQNIFTKKKIPFPQKKLSKEDLEWIDFHKELIGKTDAELAKMVIPKGILGKQLKGLTYREKDGRFIKMDGKWNARYFILYYSASWCGPCRASLPRNLEVYRDKIASRKDLEVVLCSMDRALEGAQKWAVSNKMPWPVFLFGYLDNLSKESPLIRKNYPGPIPSLVLVDANGNKIASGSMDGLVRKVEELASAEKEKQTAAEPKERSLPAGISTAFSRLWT